MKAEVILIVLIVLVSVAFASEILAGELSDTTRSRISEFLNITLEESASTADSLSNPKVVYEVSVDEIVNDIPLATLKAARWHAKVNGNSGDIYSYGRYQVFEDEKEVALTLGLLDALPRDAVVQTYMKLAEFYSVSVSPEDFRVRLVDPQARSEPTIPMEKRNLYLCYWDVRMDLNYKGYPCRGRYLNAAISPISGRIGLVGYRPVVIPEPEEWTLTSSEVLDAVRTWLSRNPYFSEKVRPVRITGLASNVIEKVIACSRRYPEERLSKGTELIGQEAYYCWEVPFEYRESGHWFSAVAWVRASDPEVIGWNNDRNREVATTEKAQN